MPEKAWSKVRNEDLNLGRRTRGIFIRRLRSNLSMVIVWPEVDTERLGEQSSLKCYSSRCYSNCCSDAKGDGKRPSTYL